MDKKSIGPYEKLRIVLCSADASPTSQRAEADHAAYFFPGGKWVGAVRNTAEDMRCRFCILTTYHGMVNGRDIITPYDLIAETNPEKVSSIWEDTVPKVLGLNKYDIMLFYSGGVPRDSYLTLLVPVLHAIQIDFLTFGKPNMFDVGKIGSVVKMIIQGTTFEKLQSILRCPDRLHFEPAA